jgi:hypothetical protein
MMKPHPESQFTQVFPSVASLAHSFTHSTHQISQHPGKQHQAHLRMIQLYLRLIQTLR